MTDQTLEQVIADWYTDDARGSHLDFDDVPALVKRIEAVRWPSDRTVQVPMSQPAKEQSGFDLDYYSNYGDPFGERTVDHTRAVTS